MSSTHRPGTAPANTATQRTSTRPKRLIDRIDQPARPLGSKRAALRQRRKASPSARQHALPPEPGVIVVGDEHLSFKLRPTAEGLLVVRSQRQPAASCLTQTLLFDEVTAFDRWCESEPARFDTPLLFGRLCREGHAIFEQR